MRMKRASLVALVAFAIMCLVAVVTPGTVTGDRVQSECLASPTDPDHRIYPSSDPVVKVIRLTDDGLFVDRCEQTDALYELQKPTGPEVVVIYIHGWKHDWSPKDTDLSNFRDVIADLNRQEALGRKRHVVGIFVTWPGRSLNIRYFRELTFWSRERAADRIAESGIVTSFLSKVESIRQRKHEPDDFVALLGHSFGARILFAASSQVLLYKLAQAYPHAPGDSYELVKGPANAIVLINPAFDAAMYSALDAVRRYKESFAGRQNPVLLTISSESDLATRIAFPIGELAGFHFGDLSRQTVGNHDAFITHTLTTNSASTEKKDYWFNGFCAAGECLRLKSEASSQPSSPFLVAKATADVIDGHSDLWNPRFRSWLVAYLRESDGHKQEGQETLGVENHDRF